MPRSRLASPRRRYRTEMGQEGAPDRIRSAVERKPGDYREHLVTGALLSALVLHPPAAVLWSAIQGESMHRSVLMDGGLAMATEPAAASLSSTFTATSDHLFDGLSQTGGRPMPN